MKSMTPDSHIASKNTASPDNKAIMSPAYVILFVFISTFPTLDHVFHKLDPLDCFYLAIYTRQRVIRCLCYHNTA